MKEKVFFCPRCGHENPMLRGAGYCGHCGRELSTLRQDWIDYELDLADVFRQMRRSVTGR